MLLGEKREKMQREMDFVMLFVWIAGQSESDVMAQTLTLNSSSSYHTPARFPEGIPM